MKYRNLVKKIAAYACMAAMVVSSVAGIGTVTAVAEEAQVSDDIILNGDESGASSMMGFNGGTGYTYAFATLKDAPADYKYLILTYSGSIANLRMEFAYVGSGGETAKVGPYWFAPTQATKFTTVGTPSMDTVEAATVVIDLEGTGISLADYNSVHIHSDVTEVKIGYARLSKTADVKADVDVMPEPGTEQETATADVQGSTEPIELAAIVGDFDSGAKVEGENYYYITGMDVVGATVGHKYLEITYKGDATAFDALRLEFISASKSQLWWFAEWQGNKFATTDGNVVPKPAAEEQTVTIDLEKSGMDLSEAITNIHMHNEHGMGTFSISSARLLAELPQAPVDPSTLEDIILNGDENGMSSMMKKYNVKVSAGSPYKYLGFATLKEPTSDYKYLILTYAGDISTVRWEFAFVDENSNETAKSVAYWFNPTQENHFVTADGSDIALNGGKGTTIVIDLEKTGIDLGTYNSVHMHGGDPELLEFTLNIGMARLSTKADLNSLDVMPTEQPSTDAPTTKIEPTTAAYVKKVTPPKRAKVKSATKKKAAKKVKISLKKIKGAKGYKVQFAATKKFKKVLVKKTVKKVKVTITSKKFKNKKKLFVRVKAYKLDGKKKIWSKKWSKVMRVKIK